MKKLTIVMTEAELERDRQRKEYASVLSERDVLRTQLMKRDAELTALYEKLKIQRSMLDKGRATFEAQQKQESELKNQIADQKADLQVSKLQVRFCEIPVVIHVLRRTLCMAMKGFSSSVCRFRTSTILRRRCFDWRRR
jgi:hypothetical protein